MTTALILTTGSRHWEDIQLLGRALMDVWHDALQLGYSGITLLNGDCDGADYQTQMWAEEYGIPHEEEPADWEAPCAPSCAPGHRLMRGGVSVCPAAGPYRNQRMVDRRPALCVAFPLRQSIGTRDCMDRAQHAGIPVLRVTVTGSAHFRTLPPGASAAHARHSVC